MMLRHIFILLAIGVLTAGCSTPTINEQARKLDLGMDKARVNEIFEDFDLNPLAMKTLEDGTTAELWEFTDESGERAYRVVFRDGRLVQYGSPEGISSLQSVLGTGASE